MNHMILIRTVRQKLAMAGVVVFLAAGFLGAVKAGYTVVMADIREAVASTPARAETDFGAVCLAEANRRGITPDACHPFTSADWQAMTGTPTDGLRLDVLAGFGYDAHRTGTSVRLPDGTYLWVPVARGECPMVTLADTDTAMCVTWVDMGTDD